MFPTKSTIKDNFSNKIAAICIIDGNGNCTFGLLYANTRSEVNNTLKKNSTKTPEIPSAYHLIDTHCHLDMAPYSDDLNKVIERASTNQVRRIVTIGIDTASSQAAVRLAKIYPQISATIGIHPHDIDNSTDADYTLLEDLHRDNPKDIVGFGEIGLDYVKQYSQPANQRTHFTRQLDLAHSMKLPVIVHNREANSDTLKILNRAKPLEHGGIMHCFSGDYDFAKKVLDLNMLISIPGIVTFKNAKELQEVARKVPLEYLVLETDGPFLAPHPYRGKRNEPGYLLYTAEKVAQLRNISIDEVARQTSINAENIFRITSKKSNS